MPHAGVAPAGLKATVVFSFTSVSVVSICVEFVFCELLLHETVAVNRLDATKTFRI